MSVIQINNKILGAMSYMRLINSFEFREVLLSHFTAKPVIAEGDRQSQKCHQNKPQLPLLTAPPKDL